MAAPDGGDDGVEHVQEGERLFGREGREADGEWA
jgi:hypothetical protein